MSKFKKWDLILASAIGLSSSLMMIFVGRNLSGENDFFKTAISYSGYLLAIFPMLCILWIIAMRFASKFIGVGVYQFGKFILTGGFNFLLDATVLNFFIFSTGIMTGLPQSGFKSVAFVFGVISSYLWNKYWSFSGISKGHKKKEIYQFLAVTLTSFILNISIDYVFVNMVGSFWNMSPALWAQFSAVLAATIAMTWNFIGYKFIVFKVEVVKAEKVIHS
ncbi:MAG: GtrA family protein [Patescibacteria group bacterium]